MKNIAFRSRWASDKILACRTTWYNNKNLDCVASLFQGIVSASLRLYR